MWTERIVKQWTVLRKSLKKANSYLILLHNKELSYLNILIDTD